MIEEEKERGITINNGIGLIGHVDIGAQVMHQAINEKMNVVVIEEAEIDNSFEINGIRYEPIKRETHNKGGGKLAGIMAVSSMFYAPYMMMGESKKTRQLPKGIDIVKEFELIQNKQSNLSKWERDQVEHIFHLNFNKI